MKTALVTVALFGALILAGCHKAVSTTPPPPPQPIQSTALDVAATAKGYLDKAKELHPECAPGVTAPNLCAILDRGTKAKDLLLDALNLYCGSPEYDKGNVVCTINASAEDKLSSALTNMNQIMGDIKSVH
jgi:hypothetical protein